MKAVNKIQDRIAFKIANDFKQEIKLAALQNRQTMTDFILSAIKEKLPIQNK